MATIPTATEIACDASWLAQAVDASKGLVRMVRMSPEAYRSASFLDDRIFSEQRESRVLPWQDVASAAQNCARNNARWIFHIGHVGSTLVARLLGELPGVLSIREPRILRDIAGVAPEQRAGLAEVVSKLLSRTFAADEKALVKATSFVSDIAPQLVPPGERALFVYATPRNYIGSILAGENSVKELAMLADFRAQRIAGRARLPQPKTGADLAAAAWACEMTALEAAAKAMSAQRIAWANFDAMLEAMPARLGRVAGLFGFAATEGQLQAIVEGPLMQRYSKALDYEYSPSLRRELIEESDAANRDDIDRAIANLQSAAETSPLLARALARANSEN